MVATPSEESIESSPVRPDRSIAEQLVEQARTEGVGLVGPGGNVFKLAYAELRQRLGDLAMHVLDRASLSIDDIAELPTHRHVQGRIHALSLGIAAGTSQVQRNIVAERILGLPKDR